MRAFVGQMKDEQISSRQQTDEANRMEAATQLAAQHERHKALRSQLESEATTARDTIQGLEAIIDKEQQTRSGLSAANEEKSGIIQTLTDALEVKRVRRSVCDHVCTQRGDDKAQLIVTSSVQCALRFQQPSASGASIRWEPVPSLSNSIQISLRASHPSVS